MPHVQRLMNPEAFASTVGDSFNGRVVVIEFSSKKCAACKTMHPRYARVAHGWPELDFYDIVYEDSNNRKLFRSFGLRKLPYIHIAAEGRLVEGFLCPPSKLSRLEAKLEAYAGCLRPHRGWLSGRRWRRLRYSRSRWWRLRPQWMGGRRFVVDGEAARPLPGGEEQLPEDQLQPLTLVSISGLASAEAQRGWVLT